MANPRVLKLADQIKTIVAQTLDKRVKDPRLGFVTITDVRLTGDTREATVFYTVYGDESELSGSAAALDSATGLIRSTVAKQLSLRHAPTITFVQDALPDSVSNIEDALARAQANDAALAAARREGAYAGDADPYRRHEEDAEEAAVEDPDLLVTDEGPDPVDTGEDPDPTGQER